MANKFTDDQFAQKFFRVSKKFFFLKLKFWISGQRTNRQNCRGKSFRISTRTSGKGVATFGAECPNPRNRRISKRKWRHRRRHIFVAASLPVRKFASFRIGFKQIRERRRFRCRRRNVDNDAVVDTTAVRRFVVIHSCKSIPRAQPSRKAAFHICLSRTIV